MAISHTLREVPDVPAATKFSQAMRQSIQHTKLLLEAARCRMSQYMDEKRTTEVPFKEGELVMLSSKYISLHMGAGCTKLLPRFVGPFKVLKAVNPVAFKLELPKTMRVHNVFHVSLLKKFTPWPGESVHPPPLIVDTDEEYEVEAVIGRRLKVFGTKKTKHTHTRRSRVEYLVRWAGYGPEHNQWLPEDEVLRHAQEAVDAYLAEHPEEIQQNEANKSRPKKKQ
jgi:hypothetical protein